jgi:hypothetical protein
VTRRVWVLNLDAELELEAERYAPKHSTIERMRAPRELVRAGLPAGDVVLDLDPEEPGLEGRCWCPTPSALARLERAGATLPFAPPIEILRAVNERGFAHSIASLDGALRCESEEAVLRAIAPQGARWIAKRAFGFAGRGQRRIDGGGATENDRAWIRASLERGALYLEPRVAIALEVGLHGLLDEGGRCRRGEPTVQSVVDGAWKETRRARRGEIDDGERRALFAIFDRVAIALHAAGYFGPFGIDAYRYLEADRARFCALSEINARYSMGWPIGMGGWE